MATASGMPDRQQRLLQLIECPICLSELQDPRLLSCRHIYCYTCLKDYHQKVNHGNALPCPQCREVTMLYQGGVDNLPKFFFMNELKEVVMTEDAVREGRLQKRGYIVCSTEDCGQPGVKYCKQCVFLCQQCYDDHSKARFTKSHQVIPASEGETFIKSKVPPYPPCHSHTHQAMDLFCLKCNQAMCNTCSNSIHDGHERCDLDQQAEVCKTKLEQICDDTDELIKAVKQAMGTTKKQVQQAEADIDDACGNVKFTFKKIHDKLDGEENQMLADLQAARRRMIKAGDVTLDSQSMTLASLERLKSCQVKLSEKDSPYDYVTVTESLKTDVENHFNKELPVVMWTLQIVKSKKFGLFGQIQIDLAESVMTKTLNMASYKQVEVACMIRLHAHNKLNVRGLVVYHQRVYVLHQSNLIVYCYAPDGSLSHKYEHEGGANAFVTGMSLVVNGDIAMLVVSSHDNTSLVWIKIIDDTTMAHHQTQQLHYNPWGSYNEGGELMVCDPNHHKIHRYRHDGQTLAVINLPDDVNPRSVTCQGDLYVVSDWNDIQVVMIDNKGQVKTRYKGDIQGVELALPSNVITDPHRGVLIADFIQNQVLLLKKTGDMAKILNVRSPRTLYLDTDHHRLYVSGENQRSVHHVFVFNYPLLKGGKEITMKITKQDLKVEI